MSKRQSLKGKGIDNLLFGISENNEKLEKEAEQKPKAKVKKLRAYDVSAKSSSEIERITVPLRFSQVEALARIERAIMKNRSRQAKKQRITKNSIIRACLEVMLGLEFDLGEISDETELTRRIQKATLK